MYQHHRKINAKVILKEKLQMPQEKFVILSKKMDYNTQHCKAEVCVPSEENWLKIRQRIIFLENEAFPTYPYSDEVLHREFVNPENIIVLLKNVKTQQIIGYIYSVMVDRWYPKRKIERNETVFLDNIVLDRA